MERFGRNYYALLVSSLFTTPIFTMATVFYVFYLMALGADYVIVGFIGFSATLVSMVSKFIGGALADSLGRKKIVVASALIGSLSAFVKFQAMHWEIFAIGVLFSAFATLGQPPLSSILVESIPPHKRGKGINFMHFTVKLVALPLPIIAAYLFEIFTFEYVMKILYLTMSIFFLISAIIRSIFLKETSKNVSKNSENPIRSYFHIFKNFRKKLAFKLLIANYFLIFALSGILFLLPLYIVEILGFSYSAWSIIFTAGRIVTLGGYIPVGTLLDKIGRKRTILIFSMILNFSVISFLFIQNLSLFLFTTIAYASLVFAHTAVTNGLFTLEADLIPKNVRSRMFALKLIINDVSSSISKLENSFLFSFCNVNIVFIHALIFIVLFSLVVHYMEEPHEKQI
ncbi:MAG: MFS transporter [Candidatus Asgardarchaeia archaeon]